MNTVYFEYIVNVEKASKQYFHISIRIVNIPDLVNLC